MTRLRNRLLIGDARTLLPTVPGASVDVVVTSPPYFRLRDYQHPGQFGLEPAVDGWVNGMMQVTAELRRILKPTGLLWLNLGDTYSRHEREGARAKSLLLAPERLALAMTNNGWLLRNKVVWAKPNPMPSPIADRLSCTYEVVYGFARSPNYFFDLDTIRVPHRSRPAVAREQPWSVPPAWRGPNIGSNAGLGRLKASGMPGHRLGKNPGDVWIIPTAGYRGAHHAVFPEALVERPLRAGCPERTCASCGLPWRRQTAQQLGRLATRGELAPSCACRAAWQPGLVLDPFMGSGTTAVVAERLGRDWLGIELNPEIAAVAERRLERARGRAAA